MMINKNVIINSVLSIVVGLTLSIFSMQQIITSFFSTELVYFTGLATFIISLCIINYMHHVGRRVFCDKGLLVISALIGIVIANYGYTHKGIYLANSDIGIIVNVFRKEFYVFSVVAITYLTYLFIEDCVHFIKKLFISASVETRKLFIISSIVASGFILLAYITNSSWFEMFDFVYGMDSDWCYEIIYKNANYYDIRHPLLGFMLFPVYAIVDEMLVIFSPNNINYVLCAAIIQIIHAHLILLSGLMLSNITSKSDIFLIYIFSFPSMLFFFSFEKYQVCIFFVIMYVYKFLMREERSVVAILLIGAMPTSGAILIIELLDKAPFKSKLLIIKRIVVAGCSTLVITGRGFLLIPYHVYSQISQMHNHFGSGTYLISERIFAFFNMLKGSLFGLPSVVVNAYTWTNVKSPPTILTVLISFFIVLGVIVGYKETFIKICLVTFVESFFLIVVLNWSPHEAPLFSFFFSWAYILMFEKGIGCIEKCSGVSSAVLRRAVVGLMLVINITMLVDINNYLKTRTVEEVVLPQVQNIEINSNN